MYGITVLSGMFRGLAPDFTVFTRTRHSGTKQTTTYTDVMQTSTCIAVVFRLISGIISGVKWTEMFMNGSFITTSVLG